MYPIPGLTNTYDGNDHGPIHIPYSTECGGIITAGTTDNPKYGVWRDHQVLQGRRSSQNTVCMLAEHSRTANRTLTYDTGIFAIISCTRGALDGHWAKSRTGMLIRSVISGVVNWYLVCH